MARIDPLRNFRYRLEIDSITQAGFSEVAIAETTIDAVDYREGTDPPHVRKLSGLTKYGNITLKWGLTVGGTALDLFKWHNDVSAGQVKEQAQEGRHRRAGRGRRRRRALRRHRRLAGQVRPERPQRQGQRSDDRAARARQRRHRAGERKEDAP